MHAIHRIRTDVFVICLPNHVSHWALRIACACVVFAAAAYEAQADDDLRTLAKSHFGKLKSVSPEEGDAELVALGRALFWDQRISASGETSCASCHVRGSWGADPRRFSVRDSGERTGRNSQTVLNATMQPRLRWLGDRRSAAHQAERSITGSLGNSSPEAAVERLREAGYEDDFRSVFTERKSPLSVEAFADAIEAYEQTLITPAPFDRFLAGDDQALSEDQKRGLRLFVDTGCADCHNGTLLGGKAMEKFGMVKDYWLATGSQEPDPGLFVNTQRDEDKYRFRVPMLRNIAKTSPYFHDGSIDELSEAIEVMAEVQLGVELADSKRKNMKAFLESLTGEVPDQFSPPAERD